jgi:hypothetical protein
MLKSVLKGNDLNFKRVFKWLSASQNTCLTFVKNIVYSADMVYVLCGKLSIKRRDISDATSHSFMPVT